MEAFPALLALCEESHQSPVDSPQKDQWHVVLMFSFICVWTNDLAHNRYTVDLRRRRAYHGVTLISHVSKKHKGDYLFDMTNEMGVVYLMQSNWMNTITL